VLGLLFVRLEQTKTDPMVTLSLFKSRNFTGANLMTFAMYGALSGCTFALVIYLQTKLHYPALKAGFSLLPVSIVMFLFAGRVGALAGRYGPRLFMSIGPFVLALGMLWLYFLQPGDRYISGILPGALLFAGGLALSVAPLTITVMSAVPEADSGIASAINNAIARLAGLFVVAALGLFGTQHVYQFAMGLCAALALLAGLLSFGVIRNVLQPSSLHS
jgi:predicted MFS family arabinose efflux permease